MTPPYEMPLSEMPPAGEPPPQASGSLPQRVRVKPDEVDEDEFSSAFSTLQSDYKQKYGRDFRITGNDTSIHKRLHGSGRARDIGGADLSDEEGGFLVERGKELGLDVGDYRKNWKQIGGSGPHIHVDYSTRLRPQAPSAPGRVRVRPDEIDDITPPNASAPVPGVKAIWGGPGGDAPVSRENTGAMISELQTNAHVKTAAPSAEQKIIYADDLPKIVAEQYGGDELKATTDLFNKGYSIVHKVKADPSGDGLTPVLQATPFQPAQWASKLVVPSPGTQTAPSGKPPARKVVVAPRQLGQHEKLLQDSFEQYKAQGNLEAANEMGLKLQKDYGWEFGSSRDDGGKEWPYIKPPQAGLSKDEAYAQSLKPGQGTEAFINQVDAAKERKRKQEEFARTDTRGPVRRFAEGANRGARETLDTMAAGAGRFIKNVQELPGDISLAAKNLTTSQAKQDRLAAQEQPSISAREPNAGERMENYYRQRAEEAQEAQALRGQDFISKAGHTVGGVAPYMIPGGGQAAFGIESGLGAYGQGQSLDKAILTGVMTVAGAHGASKLSGEFERLVAPQIAEDLTNLAKNAPNITLKDATKRYIARVGGQALGLPLIQAGTGQGVPTTPEDYAHLIAMSLGFGIKSPSGEVRKSGERAIKKTVPDIETVRAIIASPDTDPQVAEALLGIVQAAATGKPAGAMDDLSVTAAPPRLMRDGQPVAVAPGARIRVSPDEVEPAPVQKTVATVNQQMRALRDGDRYAVVITPGTEMPSVPRGYVATETEKGTFIHHPDIVTPEEVQIMVDDGNYGQLLGHIEPPALASPGLTSLSAQDAASLSPADRQALRDTAKIVKQAVEGRTFGSDAGPVPEAEARDTLNDLLGGVRDETARAKAIDDSIREAGPGAAYDDVIRIALQKAEKLTSELQSAEASPESAIAAAPDAPTKHDYSSTQVNLPDEVAQPLKQLGAKIPDADLAADGRESDSHITLKYGLHGDSADAARAILEKEPPVKVRFGKTSVFEGVEDGTADAVKVDVDSPDLHRLNKLVADALPHTDTYPEYKPHATVAYVKPGLGEKYSGDSSLEGKQITLDRVVFSARAGKQTEIQLKGKPSLEEMPVAESSPLSSSPVAKPALSLHHERFREVTVADNQTGVPDGHLRVMDADGAEHVIQNPRKLGNREAAFIKSKAEPGTASPEMASAPTERIRVRPHEVEDVAPRQTARVAELKPEVETHLTQHGLPVEEVKRSIGVDRSDAPGWVQKSDAYIKDLASGKIQNTNPVEGFLHVARVTAWDIYKATQDRAAWSREMTLRLKDRVKPHLDALWDFITAGKFGPEAVLNRLKQTRLVSHEIIADILSGKRPEYVDALIDHLAEQKQKIAKGAMTVSDLARSYFITGASQRSDAIKLSTLQAKLKDAGINIPGLEQYAEAGKSGEMKIRPEDAAGAWLMTDSGQQALADLEAGKFNEKAWREGARVRHAFGDDRIAKLGILSPPTKGATNMRNIGELLGEMNAARGNPQKLAQSISKLNGVGVGKNPFMAHLLGFGSRPTVDAIAINAYLTGRGSLKGHSGRDVELARAVKDFTGNQELMQALSDRINRRVNDLRKSGVIGSDVSPEDFGAVVHHWLWNEMKGSRHSQTAMYDAMRQEPPFIAEARARLKASLTGEQMNMNPAQAMVDEASVIGWQAIQKAKDFASWSTHMTAVLGQRIKPLLGGVWNWLRDFRSSSNKNKTGAIETASSAIKSGLLTAARVIINNPVSNATFQVMEEIARNPAAMADMVWSGARKVAGATSRRTITGSNLTAILHGAREGATRGVREAGEIMQRGATTEEMERTLQTQEVRTGLAPLDALINVPFRVQSAQDRIFRVAAFRRSLEGIAEVSGKNQGLKGAALKTHIADLVTEAMQGETLRARAMNLQATSEAEIAVFVNSNPVSDMFAGAREGLKKGGAAGAAFQFGVDRVVPFPRSGTNVWIRALDYTGVSAPFRAFAVLRRTLQTAVDTGLLSDLREGDVKRAAQTLVESVSRSDQRKVSEMIGRGLTGQAIMYLGAKLGIAGLLSGFIGSSPADRGLDEAEGKRPGALKVGKQWVELKGAGILSNLLVLGASLAEIANHPEYDKYGKRKSDAERKFRTAVDFSLDQPLGRPAKDLWEGAQAPEAKAQKMAGSIASQVVPGWMADIAAQLDTVERDTRPEGKDFVDRTVDSMKKGIMRRVPGLRQRLPEKLDALGRPVERGMYATSSRAGDPVVDELRRLDVGIGRGKHGPQVQERLASVIGSEAYSRDPGEKSKFALVDVQAAALHEAIKVARDDQAAGRKVRLADASAIIFNARINRERDDALASAKDSAFWKLSRDERRRFEQSIKREYAAARASLAPDKTVADEIADGREKLEELRSSKGEIAHRALMRAKGLPVETEH
jgi:hypothetical protein